MPHLQIFFFTLNENKTHQENMQGTKKYENMVENSPNKRSQMEENNQLTQK